MVKVTRIPLICNVKDRDNNEVDYKEIFSLLWELQNETRTIKNKAVQLLWEWNAFSSDYKLKYEEYPDEKDFLKGVDKGKGMQSFLYAQLSGEGSMNKGNYSCIIQTVYKAFKTSKVDFMKGTKSIIEYKNNQPIEVHNKSIRIAKADNEYYFNLSMLSTEAAKAINLPAILSFKGVVKDKSVRDILDRCIDGTYKISCSRLIYDKKKKWCLNLSYEFEAAKRQLDPNKILGIDLGVEKPFMASVYGDLDRLFAEGGNQSEIAVFRRKIEARKRSMLKQSKMSGDGRRGHGYATRTLSANSLEDKIAKFRDTVNHKYSRAIVEYAIKKDCGVIQMEELSGITQGEQPRYLKNWSYYDLQMKIENKAKEAGIKVKYINPRFTSQRCSKCGFIHKDNRPEQAKFICQSCGFEVNADFNASQNIAIENIDNIIKKAVGKANAEEIISSEK